MPSVLIFARLFRFRLSVFLHLADLTKAVRVLAPAVSESDIWETRRSVKSQVKKAGTYLPHKGRSTIGFCL